VNIAPRPLIPVLLGTVLLAVSACDDGDPPPAGGPGAGVHWTGFAKDCPALTGQEPGRRTAAAYDGPTLFSLRCQYRSADAEQEKIALSVTVYRAASGGSTADQLAVGAMEKDRATAPETAGVAGSGPSAETGPGGTSGGSPSPAAATQPINGLGDSAFARLVPKRGVRVYVRSANALVELDYTDPGDSRKALATATDLTRQALAGLH
jgi:hypothetical protein